MMNFQPVGQAVLPINSERLRQDAMELMQTALGDCTPEYLSAQINAGRVDSSFIDRIVDCAKGRASLLRIQKEDFIYAVSQARPDCAPLFTTAAGDRWIDLCCAEIVKRWPSLLLKTLFGGVSGR